MFDNIDSNSSIAEIQNAMMILFMTRSSSIYKDYIDNYYLGMELESQRLFSLLDDKLNITNTK